MSVARASARTANARLTLARRAAGCNPTWVGPSVAAFQCVDQGHVDPVRDGLREQPRLVISAGSGSAASGRNRDDDVRLRHQIARNRTSSHALTHEPRQGAPPVIFQAVHEGVCRRPQNDCEGGGRKLWAPSSAFDAGIGGNGA